MACRCINPDGIPAQFCTGLCTVVKPVMEDDPLKGFAELVMGQVNKLVDNRLNEFRIVVNKELNDQYRKSFLEGFKQGFRFAKEGDDYDE